MMIQNKYNQKKIKMSSFDQMLRNIDQRSLTQDKIFDFMCLMSQAMRNENIPIVNNIIYDFHKVEQEKSEDNQEKEEEYELMDG